MSVLREVAKAEAQRRLDCVCEDCCEQMVEPIREALAALDRAGWQVVPKVATPAMEDAGQMLGCWEDILAVAPKIEALL